MGHTLSEMENPEPVRPIYDEIFFPKIDKKSRFYINCKRQRKANAKICQVCPFRKGIEEREKH